MEYKSAELRALLEGVLYGLRPITDVYNVKLDGDTLLADKLQEIITSLNGKVSATTVQNLTEEQKAQARENIGAKTPYEYAKEAGYTGTDAEFAEKLAEEYPIPDWQAAEGEQGHVLNRTHWRDVTKTVLFEKTVTITQYQFMDTSGVSIPLVVGETYTVVWDGVSYEQVAKAMDYDGFDAIAVGNGEFVGAENTGEPFLILTLAGAGYGVVCLTDGEHTFAISGNEYTYHTIPPEYLAGSKPFYIDLESDEDWNIVYETDVTQNEIKNALASGYQVVVRRTLPQYNLLDLFYMGQRKNYGELHFYRITSYDIGRPMDYEFLQFTPNDAGGYDITHEEVELVQKSDLPTALKNPYALTINGTSYDGSKAVSLTIEGGGDFIPAYVRTEAERVAKLVQSRQNANTITFFACSDIHYYSPENATANANAEKMQEAVVSMGQAMGLIRERVHIDFAAMLGDMTWDYGETKDEVLAEMRFVNTCLHKGYSGIPQFRMEGNHDDAYESNNDLTAAEVFSNIGAWNDGAVYGDRAAGYCYRDFEGVKLRVIALNSSQYSGSAAQFNPEQVTWLAKALDLSNRGADWRSIILSHHPLDWGRAGGTDPTATINAASGLIASFHGHIHNFLTGTVTNTELPRIAIPNAGYSRENQYGESYGVNWKENTTYSKTPGTAQNTSFCLITIDLAAKKIYADHYGAGYDRVIPYEDAEITTFAVTNNLTNVTSSNASASVYEGYAYTATLTAASGYAIQSVTVTMGGTDITATAYSSGTVSIASVTGDIVITATAQKTATGGSYTNLVTTSIDPATGEVYNGEGKGYKNDVYGSGAGEGSTPDTSCVLTGLIAYGSGRDTPIYIKGADITTASHCRILGFDTNRNCYFQSAAGSAINTYFTVETLGDQYYKVTPILSAINGQTDYLRFSLIGEGENLIITINEPIE